MNILIIEDEKPAAEKLRQTLLAADPGLLVLATLGNVKAATEWLRQNPPPDLAFMDIELTDGLSFQIFDAVNITCPVIFTTAYNEYWQEAFEHNSIDYLLKPVRQEKLEAALQKYHKLEQHFAHNLQQMLQAQKQPQPGGFKKRWLVKRGSDYAAIKTEEIAYLYAAHKLVCLVDMNGQKFILDKSLADIEKELDPALFFRLNRKYLAQISAIGRIKAFGKGKIQVELRPAVEEDIIISQETATVFKAWLDR